MTYLMESPREGQRLLVQERANPSRESLLAAGLRPGMRVLDIGCGSGGVALAAAALVGPSGSVLGVDPSQARLDEARRLVGDAANVEFRQASFPSTGLEPDGFDFVYSQFVLEYLPDPRAALAEMVRTARPGGTVAVTDIDGLGLANWPTPQVVIDGLITVERALQKVGFDLFVGRKIFHELRLMGLGTVGVHLAPLYLVAGAAEAWLVDDWALRLENIAPVVAPAFGGAPGYEAFRQAYLDLLRNPDALKYTVALTTWGTKP